MDPKIEQFIQALIDAIKKYSLLYNRKGKQKTKKNKKNWEVGREGRGGGGGGREGMIRLNVANRFFIFRSV